MLMVYDAPIPAARLPAIYVLLVPQTCIKWTVNFNMKYICKPIPVKNGFTACNPRLQKRWANPVYLQLLLMPVFDFRQLHSWPALVLLHFSENQCCKERKNKPTFVPHLFANQVRCPWLTLSLRVIWTLTDWTQTAGFLYSGQQIGKIKIKLIPVHKLYNRIE